jgi:hypothetical protein
MINCVISFLKENGIINYRIIATVVTFNFLNSVIEDLFIPSFDIFVEHTFADHFDVYYKKNDPKKKHVLIRTGNLFKKIIFWILIISIITIISNMTSKK